MKQQKTFFIWALLMAVVALPASAQSFRSSDSGTEYMSQFGGTVAVGNGEVIVGSTGQTQSAGELYVYTKDGDSWVESGRISAENGNDDNRFGRGHGVVR